jgi:hypothetical protein
LNNSFRKFVFLGSDEWRCHLVYIIIEKWIDAEVVDPRIGAE